MNYSILNIQYKKKIIHNTWHLLSLLRNDDNFTYYIQH